MATGNREDEDQGRCASETAFDPRAGRSSAVLSISALPTLRLLVIGLGTLVVPLDSAVNVAFPHIIRQFAIPMPMIEWVVIAYVLTYTSLMLIFGHIGDVFGHKQVFLFGAAWSAVALLLCSLAPSYHWLLAARTMQGVGTALLLSCGTALATGLFPERQRAKVLGLYTMMFSLGSALGPPLAGLLIEQWGWSAVFGFRVPICIIAFSLALMLPTTPHTGARKGFDGVGALLLTASVSASLLALNELQYLPQELSPFLLLATIAGLAAIGFIRREKTVAKPIIDLKFFHDRSFMLANVGHTVVNMAGFSIMLLMPFYLDRVGNLSAPASGAMLAAAAIGMMVAAPLTGRLAGMVSPRRLLLLGTLLIAAGLAGIGFIGAGANIALLVAAMALQGVGQGIFQVAYFDIVTGTLPVSARGVAGSLGMMTRTLGVVTGASVLMLVFKILRDSASKEHGEALAFLAGFQGAFLFSSGVCVVLLLVAVSCGWLRAIPDPERRH